MWIEGMKEFLTCFTTEVIFSSVRPSVPAKTNLVYGLLDAAAKVSQSQLKIIIN